MTINVIINGEAGNSVRSKLNQVITVINDGLGANTILNGEGAPNNALGNDGDFYLNTANLNFYGPKVSGVWGSFVVLGGADGNTILNGTEVPDSGLGVDGDFYLRTSTLDFYGPKTAGAWGIGLSLIGSVSSASTLNLAEQGSTPTTPAAGTWELYTKAAGVYALDDAGNEILLGAPLASTMGTITYAATVDLDMATLNGTFQTISLTGNLELTTSNRVSGRETTLRLLADASLRTLTFPVGWRFVGAKPANIAASKVGILTVKFFGTADSDCVAAWGVEA